MKRLDGLVCLEQFACLREIKYISVGIPFEGVQEDWGRFGEQDPFTSAGGHGVATAQGRGKKGARTRRSFPVHRI